MSEVVADIFRRLGMNLDYVATDWGTVLRRQANREPPEGRRVQRILHLHGGGELSSTRRRTTSSAAAG